MVVDDHWLGKLDLAVNLILLLVPLPHSALLRTMAEGMLAHLTGAIVHIVRP